MVGYIEVTGDYLYLIIIIGIVLLGFIRLFQKAFLDKYIKRLAADLSTKGNADLRVAPSGLMYFGSMMGSYNGVYIELFVENMEADVNFIDSLFSRSHADYKEKPFLCYTLTYKGQKRRDQFPLPKLSMNFIQVQEKLLKDVEELLSLDSNE